MPKHIDDETAAMKTTLINIAARLTMLENMFDEVLASVLDIMTIEQIDNLLSVLDGRTTEQNLYLPDQSTQWLQPHGHPANEEGAKLNLRRVRDYVRQVSKQRKKKKS